MKVIISEPSLEINASELKKAAHVFRAINHPLRQQLLKFLHERGRVIVTEVYVHFRIEQSVASQQLAILRNVDLVTTTRVGKFIHYSVNYERFLQVQLIMAQLTSPPTGI